MKLETSNSTQQAELPLAKPVASLPTYVPKKKKQIRAAWWFSKMRSVVLDQPSRNSGTQEKQNGKRSQP